MSVKLCWVGFCSAIMWHKVTNNLRKVWCIFSGDTHTYTHCEIEVCACMHARTHDPALTTTQVTMDHWTWADCQADELHYLLSKQSSDVHDILKATLCLCLFKLDKVPVQTHWFRLKKARPPTLSVYAVIFAWHLSFSSAFHQNWFHIERTINQFTDF